MRGRYREGRYQLPTTVVSDGFILVDVRRIGSGWLWTHVQEDGVPRGAASRLDRDTWVQLQPVDSVMFPGRPDWQRVTPAYGQVWRMGDMTGRIVERSANGGFSILWKNGVLADYPIDWFDGSHDLEFVPGA